MKRHQDVWLHLVTFCSVQASMLFWLFLPRMLCLLSVRYITYVMVSWYKNNRLCRLFLLWVCRKSSRVRLLKQEGQSSCRTGIMKLCVPVVCWLKWCSTGMPLKHSWFCPQDSSPTCGHLLQVTSFPVTFQSILSIKPLKSSQRSLLMSSVFKI